METILEPIRIKAIEPIRMTTPEERRRLLKHVTYNLFGLASNDVMIDLLTDSGTSAMSEEQRAAVMRGDEPYAGSLSFYRIETAVRDLKPYDHVIPSNRDRAAVAILISIIGGPGKSTPSNTNFYTPRANVEATGTTAIDLLIPESLQTFKSNIEVGRLKSILRKATAHIPVVMLTVTNNAGGGQLSRLANIHAAAQIAHRHGKPLFIDGCRFAGNAWFIGCHEPGQAARSVPDRVPAMLAVADGMTMSAIKDAFVAIGGWLAPDVYTLAVSAQPADTDRGVPDLRRTVGARPRGDRRRPARDHRRAVPAGGRGVSIVHRLADTRGSATHTGCSHLSCHFATRARLRPSHSMSWAASARTRSAP